MTHIVNAYIVVLAETAPPETIDEIKALFLTHGRAGPLERQLILRIATAAHEVDIALNLRRFRPTSDFANAVLRLKGVLSAPRVDDRAIA